MIEADGLYDKERARGLNYTERQKLLIAPVAFSFKTGLRYRFADHWSVFAHFRFLGAGKNYYSYGQYLLSTNAAADNYNYFLESFSSDKVSLWGILPGAGLSWEGPAIRLLKIRPRISLSGGGGKIFKFKNKNTLLLNEYHFLISGYETNVPAYGVPGSSLGKERDLLVEETLDFKDNRTGYFKVNSGLIFSLNKKFDISIMAGIFVSFIKVNKITVTENITAADSAAVSSRRYTLPGFTYKNVSFTADLTLAYYFTQNEKNN
ncbi:MAG TPA: hypothetical protein VKS21_06385 [Spirochaetota bacterium]|nr:hypothetical protein [Spirochaetota bacterium]